jgi:DNA-binding SARP family transcriptional activator
MMPSLETEKPTISQMDVIQSAWNQIRAQLETEKARLYEAIGNYPSPIAGCDQQFNYLLEEQSKISRELYRLNGAATANLTIADSIELIDEFIRSSGYVDPEAEQTIRSYLQEGLSRL